MLKNRNVLRGFAIGILLIASAYLVYSIIFHPFGEQDIMLPLTITAGFISLSFNKNEDKGE